MTQNFNKRSKLYLLTPAFFWTIIVISSLTWNLITAQNGLEQTICNIGRSFFQEIETTRLWNAEHGGVYVPVTEKTKPNLYLDVPNRDIVTTKGIELTLVNPAFMTRQISEIAMRKNNIQYHITSLKPIRRANKADEWETSALYGFEGGNKEFFQFIPGSMVFRYMAPLPVMAACLKCHSKQGYKLGDIRGGISVTIPVKIYIDASNRTKYGLILIHMMAFLLGIGLFYFLNRFRDEYDQNLGLKNQVLEKEIAERKLAEVAKEKLEAQLRQTQKMVAIGTMAGGIAHNFNNILGSILGYADMAKDEIPQGSTAYKDIEKVLVSAYRAKELVKHIMTFSQRDNSHKERHQPDILLREALASIKDLIPNNIQVNRNISSDVGDIKVDSFHFKKVIVNLCKNALDAMRGGEGVLGVILENIELKSADMLGELKIKPGDFVKLTISDKGHGITTENMERIFDPFFTTREVGQGDGIGLSVVHGIVRKSGGMIKVESEIGIGSTFHVFLPVAESISKD